MRTYLHKTWQTHEAVLGLALVALAWGTTFPLIRIAMLSVEASLFVALRFSIACAVLGVYLLARGRFRSASRRDFAASVGIGVVVGVVYLSQTIGLKTVPSPRAAFLTGANVLFVPLLTVLLGNRPSRIEVFSAVVAFSGLYFLADPWAGSAETSRFTVSAGDLWILMCAVFLAIQMHLVKAVSQRGADPAVLAFGQIFGVMCFSWGICLATSTGASVRWTWELLGILVFLSLGISLAAFYLHSRYQRVVTAEKASVIFGLEPVSAAFFGFLILGETLTERGWVGATLMVLALAVPVAWHPRSARPLTA